MDGPRRSLWKAGCRDQPRYRLDLDVRAKTHYAAAIDAQPSFTSPFRRRFVGALFTSSVARCDKCRPGAVGGSI